MNATVRGSLVVLAWFDSAGNADATLAAISDGKRVSAESALTMLFGDGLAGAAQVLPWLAQTSRPNLRMCAYAAISGAPKQPSNANQVGRGRVQTGFVLNPDPDDIIRLDAEFRTTAREMVGDGADPFIDTVQLPRVDNRRMEINIFEGTAHCGGREIALSDGEFAVTAMLALNRQGCSREAWCNRLWPDRDNDAAGRLLKVYIHRIRAKFGTSGVIDTHSSGYRLGSDVVVDIHVIEALARKHKALEPRPDAAEVRIFQRAFDGFKDGRHRRLCNLERFDEFERRLVATGVELARLLVEVAFLEEDGNRALTIAEHLQTVDPYDDVAAELLIRAQLRLGRPDLAQRHFTSFCRTLRDELDLPPPPHLSQLLAQQ